MLDNLRRLGRTWVGKVLGAFLLVGLAGFGISNVLLDFGANNVATVGSEDVTIPEFQRAYNADVNRFAQQIGRMPTPEEAMSFGIPSSTLNQLAAEPPSPTSPARHSPLFIPPQSSDDSGIGVLRFRPRSQAEKGG